MHQQRATMISDEDAEKAADFLRDNAKKAGELRGDRIYAENYLKHLKALLMAQANDQPVNAREQHAYAHERYLEHLKALRSIVGADEENRALREAAVMRIEVWRSWSANVRGKI